VEARHSGAGGEDGQKHLNGRLARTSSQPSVSPASAQSPAADRGDRANRLVQRWCCVETRFMTVTRKQWQQLYKENMNTHYIRPGRPVLSETG
jgi:hypothetical protein